MIDSVKEKTVSGLFWSFIENFSLKGIQFIIGILMARFLFPSDYGLIAMLAIFLGISRIFIDGGFTTALIQKTNRTEIDFSTIYYFNILASLFIYLVLFFSAPLIASFYNLPELTIITRIISLNLVFASFSAVVRTKLTIDVDFKTQAKVSLLSVFISGTIGVFMAYFNYGVWALVSQSLLNTLAQTFFLFYFVRWKPIFVFSFDSFKSLFSFSSNLVVSQLISTLYANLYTLVIGKQFNAADLGIYSRAEAFSQFPASNISSVLSRVTFPILSSISEENVRLKGIYIKYLKFTSYIVFPIMFSLIAIASPLIEIVLTSKWIDTVIILQILCLGFMWDPIGFLNINLLYIKGKPKSILRLEIVKKSIAIIILFTSIPFGITYIAIGRAFYSFLAVYINTYFTKKLISFTYVHQIKLIFPNFVLSLIMSLSAYYLSLFISSLLLKLVFIVIFSVIFYSSISYLFKFEEFKIILEFIKKIRTKK
jgi:O-antigen/teichoic acid export membrane protein